MCRVSIKCAPPHPSHLLDQKRLSVQGAGQHVSGEKLVFVFHNSFLDINLADKAEVGTRKPGESLW